MFLLSSIHSGQSQSLIPPRSWERRRKHTQISRNSSQHADHNVSPSELCADIFSASHGQGICLTPESCLCPQLSGTPVMLLEVCPSRWSSWPQFRWIDLYMSLDETVIHCLGWHWWSQWSLVPLCKGWWEMAPPVLFSVPGRRSHGHPEQFRVFIKREQLILIPTRWCRKSINVNRPLTLDLSFKCFHILLKYLIRWFLSWSSKQGLNQNLSSTWTPCCAPERVFKHLLGIVLASYSTLLFWKKIKTILSLLLIIIPI